MKLVLALLCICVFTEVHAGGSVFELPFNLFFEGEFEFFDPVDYFFSVSNAGAEFFDYYNLSSYIFSPMSTISYSNNYGYQSYSFQFSQSTQTTGVVIAKNAEVGDWQVSGCGTLATLTTAFILPFVI